MASERAAAARSGATRTGCVLLTLVLLTSGCTAARSPAELIARPPDAAPPTCSSEHARHQQTEPVDGERDAADVALEVATTVLLAGAIAAAVVFGAHGGALTPPLQLDGTAQACVARDGATACAADAPPCPDGTTQASPG